MYLIFLFVFECRFILKLGVVGLIMFVGVGLFGLFYGCSS